MSKMAESRLSFCSEQRAQGQLRANSTEIFLTFLASVSPAHSDLCNEDERIESLPQESEQTKNVSASGGTELILG